MKKLIITLSLFAFNHFLTAQTDLYFKIRQLINQTHPEITTDGKLIAFNTWSIDNPESREANKAFEKAYSVYRVARLKGGLNGLVVISISKDNLSSMATITLNKDGVEKAISFKVEDFQDLASEPAGNGVFDAKGIEVYKDLPSSTIFETIQHLITR